MAIFYPIVIASVVVTNGSLRSPVVGQTRAVKDRVFALVDGFEILMSDVDAVRPNLPPRASQSPGKVVEDVLLKRFIDARLTAVEGRRQGIHQNPTVKRRIERTVEQLLQNALPKKRVEQKLGEEQLRQAFRKMLRDIPSGDAVRARHILLKTEKEALTVLSRAQEGEYFAKLAQEFSTGPSSKSRIDLGYFA